MKVVQVGDRAVSWDGSSESLRRAVQEEFGLQSVAEFGLVRDSDSTWVDWWHEGAQPGPRCRLRRALELRPEFAGGLRGARLELLYAEAREDLEHGVLEASEEEKREFLEVWREALGGAFVACECEQGGEEATALLGKGLLVLGEREEPLDDVQGTRDAQRLLWRSGDAPLEFSSPHAERLQLMLSSWHQAKREGYEHLRMREPLGECEREEIFESEVRMKIQGAKKEAHATHAGNPHVQCHCHPK